jgi:hypothetical protein
MYAAIQSQATLGDAGARGLHVLLRWLRYVFLSKVVDWRRKELTTLLTWTAPSSTPSSASSAEALAPVSVAQLDLRQAVGRWRGLLTDFDSAESDHGAVDFVHGSIDLLQIIGVGDDLVTGDDILEG